MHSGFVANIGNFGISCNPVRGNFFCEKVIFFEFFCQKFWRFRFLLYLCTTKTEQCSVRLAGPGRKILILEIMGSNPIPSTTISFSLRSKSGGFVFCACSASLLAKNKHKKQRLLPKASVLNEFVVQLPRGSVRDGQALAQPIPKNVPKKVISALRSPSKSSFTRVNCGFSGHRKP